MIEDAGAQMLYADISCETVPEGATLVLWLVQGEVVKSVDVTNLSEPLEYPLNDFENGKIHVRLQINGVEDTISEIYVKYIETIIPEDDSVRLHSQFVEAMDLTDLYST